MSSRSAEAVLWLDETPDATQAEAAEKFNVAASTISRALAKRAEHGKCECCGQLLKVGVKPGPRTDQSNP